MSQWAHGAQLLDEWLHKYVLRGKQIFPNFLLRLGKSLSRKCWQVSGIGFPVISQGIFSSDFLFVDFFPDIFQIFFLDFFRNLEVGSLAGERDRLSRDISTVSRCTNRSGTSYHNTDHLAATDPPIPYKLNFAQLLRVLRFKNVLRNNISLGPFPENE